MNDKTINKDNEDWDLLISSKSGWLDFRLNDIWRYRDLLLLFVRRDFVAEYKQTILGPLLLLAFGRGHELLQNC